MQKEKKAGKFIVFEGIDGSGKSTLSKNCFQYFNKENISVILHHEPTDLETGKFIRRFLRGEISLSRQEQFQYFLNDRRNSLETNILPNLKNGIHVLLDRYIYSTAAYQSYENLSPKKIMELNQKEDFPMPDLLIYIDISPEAAQARLKKRGSEIEVFESIEKQKKIYAAYEEIIDSTAIRIDGTLSEEEMLSVATKSISKIIAE